MDVPETENNVNLRLRSRGQQLQETNANDTTLQDRIERPRSRTDFSFSVMQPKAATTFFILSIIYLIMGIFVHYRMNSYPNPKNRIGSHPSEFVEENARRHLQKLTALGPKVSGSEANFKAEQYIVDQIENIRAASISMNNIDIDVQTVTGGFTLEFGTIGQFSSVYQDLRNIIVKVSPPHNATHSVLVNCHYDTVADSPGKILI